MLNELKNSSFYYFLASLIGANLNLKRKPYKLSISLTGKCNLSCKYCNVWKTKVNDNLDENSIIKLFNNNPLFSWIDCTGGEIFVREDIEKILYLICKNSKHIVYLHFPTNGLLTDKIVKTTKYLSKKFPNIHIVITVSLDGCEKVHNKLRGNNNSFNNALNTFFKLRNIKNIEVYIGHTYGILNRNELPKMIRYFKRSDIDIKWKDIHVNIAIPSKIYYRNSEKTFTDRNENYKFLEYVRKHKKIEYNLTSILERVFLNNAIKYYKNGERLKCSAASDSIFIREDGNIYPCIMKNIKLGNIHENNYDLTKIIDLSQCKKCYTPCEAYIAIISNAYSVPFSIL